MKVLQESIFLNSYNIASAQWLYMLLDILGYFKYFPDITIYNLRINKKIKKKDPVKPSF